MNLLLVFTLFAAEPAPPPAETPRPNVLFIAADDMKPSLGCYGDKLAKTPAIDSIAAHGTVFQRSYCQWPVCGPSRSSLLTSRRPESSGVCDLKTDARSVHPDIVTLPQHFRQHGYATAAVGKIFDPRCCDEGHDSPSWSIPYVKIKAGQLAKESKRFASAPDVTDDKVQDGAIGAGARELLAQLAAGKQPFFLAVGFKKPHLPCVAPKKYWDLFQREDFPLAPYQGGVKDDSGFVLHDSPELRGFEGVPASGPIPAEIQREVQHGYYACTAFVDAQIAALLADLKKRGLDKNTIIVVWGDHGFHLGDHGMWAKHSVLEEAARVPLIISVPGGKAQMQASPVEFTDIFPTLSELAGLPAAAGVEGKSLKPLLDGRAASVHAGALTVFKNKGAAGYSFRTERYRYTEWISNKDGKLVASDLFDYENDPLEKVNLAADPAHAALVKELAAALRASSAGCLRLRGETSPIQKSEGKGKAKDF
ncbi:MAG: hypothetical protein RL095_3 [Verrucomicrobiota bacterium]|jgi:arylsulfatase A-like enzyme